LFANERRMKIMEMLEQTGSVTVAELVKLFHVSTETVRRDLEYLEKRQALKRVHGGAVSFKKMKAFARLELRMTENRELKRYLSGIAASFIQEHDTIAIDSGSTAMEFVPFLKEQFRHLTVVTNSPDVFAALSDQAGFELILIGGQYLREERAFYGHMALDAVSRLHFSKSFVFPSAISLRYGVSMHVHELFDIQRVLIRNADEVFILADSSKFEQSAPIILCDLSPSFKIITDHQLSDHLASLYKKKGLTVIRQLHEIKFAE